MTKDEIAQRMNDTTGEPQEPAPEDCCGEGCSSCVWDIYRERLQQWNTLKGQPDTEGQSQISKIKFTDFTLLSIKMETTDTSLYRFQLGEDNLGTNIPLKPGQHLEMRGQHENEAIIRKYSPINWKSNEFEVIIRRYDSGKMSNVIRNLNPGMCVEWRGPYGNFNYTPNEHKLLLILCVGTGVAPMIPIIRAIVDNPEDETVVKMLCGCRSLEARLLLSDLKQAAAFWNFSFTHHVTSLEGQPGWGEVVERARILEEDVIQALDNTQVQKCRVLICGTDSFVRDMTDIVKKLGLLYYSF